MKVFCSYLKTKIINYFSEKIINFLVKWLGYNPKYRGYFFTVWFWKNEKDNLIRSIQIKNWVSNYKQRKLIELKYLFNLILKILKEYRIRPYLHAIKTEYLPTLWYYLNKEFQIDYRYISVVNRVYDNTSWLPSFQSWRLWKYIFILWIILWKFFKLFFILPVFFFSYIWSVLIRYTIMHFTVFFQILVKVNPKNVFCEGGYNIAVVLNIYLESFFGFWLVYQYIVTLYIHIVSFCKAWLSNRFTRAAKFAEWLAVATDDELWELIKNNKWRWKYNLYKWIILIKLKRWSKKLLLAIPIILVIFRRYRRKVIRVILAIKINVQLTFLVNGRIRIRLWILKNLYVLKRFFVYLKFPYIVFLKLILIKYKWIYMCRLWFEIIIIYIRALLNITIISLFYGGYELLKVYSKIISNVTALGGVYSWDWLNLLIIRKTPPSIWSWLDKNYYNSNQYNFQDLTIFKERRYSLRKYVRIYIFKNYSLYNRSTNNIVNWDWTTIVDRFISKYTVLIKIYAIISKMATVVLEFVLDYPYPF